MRLIDADKLYEEFKNGPSDTQEEREFNQVGRYLVRHAPTVDLSATDQWISISEKLPQDNKDVLICAADKNGDMSIHISSYGPAILGGQAMDYKRWSEPYELFSHHHKITHWMPLPVLPEKN